MRPSLAIESFNLIERERLSKPLSDGGIGILGRVSKTGGVVEGVARLAAFSPLSVFVRAAALDDEDSPGAGTVIVKFGNTPAIAAAAKLAAGAGTLC
jgi:hypothetical protein